MIKLFGRDHVLEHEAFFDLAFDIGMLFQSRQDVLKA